MKNSALRSFKYECKCGHLVKVFFDFGIPQEFYKCRKCGTKVQREEL